MSPEELIAKMQRIAADEEQSDSLLELSAASLHPDLFDSALEHFGSWDAALVACLRDAVSAPQGSRRRSSGASASGSGASGSGAAGRDETPPEREVTGEVRDPLYTTTVGGAFFWVDGEELDRTDSPEVLDVPPGAAAMKRFFHVGDPDGIFLFSTTGRYYGMDKRMISQWMGPSEVKDLHDSLPMMEDEEIALLLPRSDMYEQGRYIHVTRDGKGKASDIKEIGRALDRTGREAFLVNDGDEPVAIWTAPLRSTVFCASANGLGIHFDAKADMRTMGRKAVGVNVMKLDDDGDHVVNAFRGDDGVEQLAVITQRGLGKRIGFEDFRTQGRGGAGMQVCKLDSGDRVAGVVPVDPAQDLAITTSTGRVHRLEAHVFPSMGRPAKGNRMIELESGEVVIGLSALPTS
jgi:DNA gyrase/topoisomerase IV subunit A